MDEHNNKITELLSKAYADWLSANGFESDWLPHEVSRYGNLTDDQAEWLRQYVSAVNAIKEKENKRDAS